MIKFIITNNIYYSTILNTNLKFFSTTVSNALSGVNILFIYQDIEYVRINKDYLYL